MWALGIPRLRARRLTWASGVCGTAVMTPVHGRQEVGRPVEHEDVVGGGVVGHASAPHHTEPARGDAVAVHLAGAGDDDVAVPKQAVPVGEALALHAGGEGLLVDRADEEADLAGDLGREPRGERFEEDHELRVGEGVAVLEFEGPARGDVATRRDAHEGAEAVAPRGPEGHLVEARGVEPVVDELEVEREAALRAGPLGDRGHRGEGEVAHGRDVVARNPRPVEQAVPVPLVVEAVEARVVEAKVARRRVAVRRDDELRRRGAEGRPREGVEVARRGEPGDRVVLNEDVGVGAAGGECGHGTGGRDPPRAP